MSIHEQLSMLLSGDLPQEEAEALRARIDAEPEVAAAWTSMQGLARGLVSLPDPELPAGLLDSIAPAPSRRAPTWSRWALPLAAASLLVALAWPTPADPATITLGAGDHLVEGAASVRTGDVTTTIDGRARLVLGEEDDMKHAAIGAAAGALLTVAVYEGTALVQGPGGDVAVKAGETWEAPAVKERARMPAESEPPAPPEVSVANLDECRASVDSLTSSLEQSQMQTAFLRGQLATHEGDPVAWPDDVPDALRAESLEATFAEAFDGIGTIVEIDCEEYPCILVIDEGANPDPDAWRAALEKVEGEIGDINAMVARAQTDDEDGSHALGGYAISAGGPDAEPPGPRTRFRMDQVMESVGED